MIDIATPLLDYPGYEITKSGTVFSLPNASRPSRRVLKPRQDKDGYWVINIRKDGLSKTVKVHRLVAITFLPNLHNKPQVNHIDENRANCHLDNLEWATPTENARHSIPSKYARHGGRWHNAKLTPEAAYHIREMYGTGMVRFSELAKLFGVSLSLIDKVTTGKAWA